MAASEAAVTVALRVSCPRCGERVGQRCRKSNGDFSTFSHQPRLDLALGNPWPFWGADVDPDRGPAMTPDDARPEADEGGEAWVEVITVDEALRRVEAIAVSRAAVLGAWPECHRAKCSGRHPSPDEAFNLFMAKIREALRHPETNWRYRVEVDHGSE